MLAHDGPVHIGEWKESFKEELGQADDRLVAGWECAEDPVSWRKGRRVGSGDPEAQEKNSMRRFTELNKKENKTDETFTNPILNYSIFVGDPN